MTRAQRFKKVGKVIGYGTLACVVLLVSAMFVRGAITRIAGLAVAQNVDPTTSWSNLRDANNGDNLTKGLLASGCFFFDGTDFDRCRGSIAKGLLVDTGRAVGTGFFSIEVTNLTTTSQNFAFGFTSKKILIEAPSTNTDDVCLDWGGGIAACPALNTAGNQRLNPGTQIILDDMEVTNISVIAASGTQTFGVTAWQ